jgi:hypothetical protein
MLAKVDLTGITRLEVADAGVNALPARPAHEHESLSPKFSSSAATLPAATSSAWRPSVVGLRAYAKGVSLRIIKPSPDLVRERGERRVDLLGWAVPVVRTSDGLRAVNKGKPCSPASVEKYLASKFGPQLEEARAAMEELAAFYNPAELQRRGFRLYESFRPSVPRGESGWGALGELDLAKVRAVK